MKSAELVLAALLLVGGCSKSDPVPSTSQSASEEPARVAVDAQTQKQLEIEVEPVRSAGAGAPIAATGQLQVNEDRTWKVGAVIGGKIVSVPFRLGDTVRIGQVVARMHSHEVHDARATHRQAVAELNRLTVLAEQALKVKERTQRLFDLKAASREQLEAAETQYRGAQLNVSAAQAEVEKAEFHLTEFLEVSLADPKLAGEKATDADQVPIKSPASGTVMERLANDGAVVSPGDPIFTISDLSSLWLIAAVNEADLSAIRPGQTAQISVRAYPDRKFQGRVSRLGERMDPQTRTLQVRVLLANPSGLLKPGMFATVELDPSTQSSALQVPESALQEWNGKQIVFVRTEAGDFAPREVKTGLRRSQYVEVISGLESGTPVVVRGGMILRGQLLKGSE